MNIFEEYKEIEKAIREEEGDAHDY